jgi:hypothetical protein
MDPQDQQQPQDQPQYPDIDPALLARLSQMPTIAAPSQLAANLPAVATAPILKESSPSAAAAAPTAASTAAAPAAPGSLPNAPNAPILKETEADKDEPSALEKQTAADEQHLADLKQSRIGNIHNPILRGLARVGNTVGSALVPGVMATIPGTTLNENWQQNIARNRVAKDLAAEQSAATTEKRQAEAENVGSTKKVENKTFDYYTAAKPNGLGLNPAQAYAKLKQDAQVKPDNLDREAYDWFIKQNFNPGDAYSKVLELKANAANKPDTAAQHKMAFEGLMAKIQTQEGMPADALTDANKLVAWINKSQVLTPQEKHEAFAFLIANPTPATTSTTGQIRANILADPRWEANEIARNKQVGPYIKKYEDAAGVDDLATLVMQDVEKAGGKISGPQFMQLLSYHLAGTMGAVPGASSGIETLKEHIKARSWSESLQAMYNAAVNGGDVSLDQAKQWAHMAGQRRQVFLRQAQEMNSLYGGTLGNIGNVTPPATNPTGGGDTIRVQIPGHPPGTIKASEKERFLKDHPNAQVVP